MPGLQAGDGSTDAVSIGRLVVHRFKIEPQSIQDRNGGKPIAANELFLVGQFVPVIEFREDIAAPITFERHMRAIIDMRPVGGGLEEAPRKLRIVVLMDPRKMLIQITDPG